MDKETIERLKKYPRYKKCKKCGSKRSYTNPFDKCYECGGRFCFDHIYGRAIKKGMKINESVRSVCEDCFERLGYSVL